MLSCKNWYSAGSLEIPIGGFLHRRKQLFRNKQYIFLPPNQVYKESRVKSASDPLHRVGDQ